MGAVMSSSHSLRGKFKVCPVRKSQEYRSQRERQISVMLDDLGIGHINNDRVLLDGYEIDIYIPSLKVGFEFNSLEYHSHCCNNHPLPSPKDVDYHWKKTTYALSKGIRLYHFWDYGSLDSVKLCIQRTLSGDLFLTKWVDKNPDLSVSSIRLPLYFVVRPNMDLCQGTLCMSKPLEWDSRITVYEFYNAGFSKIGFKDEH